MLNMYSGTKNTYHKASLQIRSTQRKLKTTGEYSAPSYEQPVLMRIIRESAKWRVIY